MAKFHISNDGTPRACSARIACPLGGPDAHYESAEQARAAYEAQHQTFNAPTTWATLELSDPDNVVNEIYQPTWQSSSPEPETRPVQSLQAAKLYATKAELDAVAKLPSAHRAPYWEARRAYLTHEESILFAQDWRQHLTEAREAFFADPSLPLPTQEDFDATLANHRTAAGHA